MCTNLERDAMQYDADSGVSLFPPVSFHVECCWVCIKVGLSHVCCLEM